MNSEGPIAARTEAFPRRVVFVGTTNEADFIRERTSGARRFLPVLCGIERTESSVFDESFPAAVHQAGQRPHVDEDGMIPILDRPNA